MSEVSGGTLCDLCVLCGNNFHSSPGEARILTDCYENTRLINDNVYFLVVYYGNDNDEGR